MTFPVRRVLRTLALLLTAASVTACGSQGSTQSRGAELEIERGAEVYAQSCASCHGADLRGSDKGPSHLSVVYEPSHHTDDAFRSAIANGAPEHHWTFGAMDAVEGLSASEVEAVIAFVRAEQERLGFDQ